MSWEGRSGTKRARYYYRAERRDGKVVKVYLGRGPQATVAAEADAAARKAHEADVVAARALEAELEPLEEQTLAMMASIEQITEAALEAAGCYRHHGTWRRRRANT